MLAQTTAWVLGPIRDLFVFGQLAGSEQEGVSECGESCCPVWGPKAEWPPEGGLPGEKLGCADSDAAEFGSSG